MISSQLVNKQFPKEHYFKHSKPVIFEGQEKMLRIHVNSANLPGGWHLQLIDKDQVR